MIIRHDYRRLLHSTFCFVLAMWALWLLGQEGGNNTNNFLQKFKKGQYLARDLKSRVTFFARNIGPVCQTLVKPADSVFKRWCNTCYSLSMWKDGFRCLWSLYIVPRVSDESKTPPFLQNVSTLWTSNAAWKFVRLFRTIDPAPFC